MNNLKKICKECGKDITNRDPRSKFCSRQCKGRFNYQLTKEIKKLNEIKTSGKKRCEFCGEVLENERKNKRFCNENCYAKARYRRIMENQNIKPIESARICKECGNVFISNRKGKIFCTESCSRRYHKRIYKRNKREKEKVQLIRNCLFCGKEFVTGKKVKKYCSNKCSYSYHNEQKRINELRQKNIEEIKLDIKQLSINEIKSIKTKKICKHCGVSFTTANERKIYCSEKCGSTFRNQRRARRLLEDKKQVATKTIQSSVKVEESVCKLDTLPKVGVYFGKFIPPHRGHLNAIIHAATRCQKLYVVVSDNKERTKKICRESGIKNIPVNLRIQWLSQELQDLEHIKVVKLDESNIPEYPNGWEKWGKLMKEAVGEHIDIMFCGEKEYVDGLKKHIHNDVKVELFDPERTTYNISATEIRENPYKHWDYILGPARPFFAKRILIAGTESSGKSTLVKYLAKIYHTSWSEEVGRYYAKRYLGGNETIFTDEDFGRIANQQVEQDFNALRSANRVCFFDTDAVVTQYYSLLYMGHRNDMVEACVDPNKYDLVLLLKPDVEWVSDGQRLNGEQEKREQLYERLKHMYIERGFQDKIIEIGGNYYERTVSAISAVNNLYK